MSHGAWLADHPVLEALWRRRKSGEAPGARSDDFKIGLAVEGGGMRGRRVRRYACALENAPSKESPEVDKLAGQKIVIVDR